MSEDMAENWRWVGQRIEQRINELGMTKAEVCRISAVSDVTLNSYISGSPIRRADKSRGLATALRWTFDSFERIAEGGDPVEVGSPPPPTLDDRLARLEERFDEFERLLRESISRSD